MLVTRDCWHADLQQEAPDILWGLARNLHRLGALPEKLVWDREAAIAAGGRPTAEFAAFCGQLEVGWVILAPRDPQGAVLLETMGPAGRCWHPIAATIGRTVRGVPSHAVIPRPWPAG